MRWWENVGTRLLLNGQLKEPAAPGSDGLNPWVTMGSNKHPGFTTERWKDLQGSLSKVLETNQVDCCKCAVKKSPVKTVTISDSPLLKLPRFLEQVYLPLTARSFLAQTVFHAENGSPHVWSVSWLQTRLFTALMFFFLSVFCQALQMVSSTFQNH